LIPPGFSLKKSVLLYNDNNFKMFKEKLIKSNKNQIPQVEKRVRQIGSSISYWHKLDVVFLKVMHRTEIETH
jgi:hypothetical protein